MSTRDEDAAWQQIIDNYGDRPEVDPADQEPDPYPGSEAASPDRWSDDDPAEPFRLELYDEEFVPPPLPPPVVMRPERRVAWVGLIGAPALLLFFTLLDYSLDPVITALLVIAFLASFGYLVATMEPHDPDDDGARV